MAGEGPISVVVVDDHELVLEALGMAIDANPDLEMVAAARSAAEGLATIERDGPDIAILDVSLPDGTGIELCREIRSRAPEVRCIVLTGSVEDLAVDAFMAGASAFISKTTGVAGIVDTIRRVHGGEMLIDSSATRSVVEKLLRAREEEAPLSERERLILELIAEGHSNREIAQRLSLAEQTVKNYVSSLLAKLGLKRRTQAARYIIDHPREGDWRHGF